jgi:hypothetical protein
MNLIGFLLVDFGTELALLRKTEIRISVLSKVQKGQQLILPGGRGKVNHATKR